MKCRDCMWWEDLRNEFGSGDGECRRIFVETDERCPASSGAYIADPRGEGVDAHFVTRPDFGCTMYEPAYARIDDDHLVSRLKARASDDSDAAEAAFRIEQLTGRLRRPRP